ncbi:MAG TPA: molybdenum cofactor guanylyltransferase [Methanocorpusculum sp.]|nr:molybdenum cofactor guanylyltransferase [Methanocorpusculum sp.]
MKLNCSAMILAGGEAKRAEGREKYFFSYKGCSFISRLVNVFQDITDEVVIVAKNERQCEHFKGLPEFVRCTWDKEPKLGPIGGICSGIDEINGDCVFIAACDMPTVSKSAVSFLFDNIGEYDVIIPEWDNENLEPLHAVYKTEAVRRYISENKTGSLRSMLETLNTKKVSAESFRSVDPELETFRNVNTLDDLLKMGPDASYERR